MRPWLLLCSLLRLVVVIVKVVKMEADILKDISKARILSTCCIVFSLSLMIYRKAQDIGLIVVPFWFADDSIKLLKRVTK